MITKILLVVIVVLAAFFLMRGLRRPSGHDSSRTSGTEGGDMVRCSHCGVHVPREEALGSAGQFFCSENHLQEYRDKPRKD